MTDLEITLTDLLKAERERSHQLTMILLKQSGLLDEKVIVAESLQGTGKLPWEMQKTRLEKAYRKTTEYSVAGEDTK